MGQRKTSPKGQLWTRRITAGFARSWHHSVIFRWFFLTVLISSLVLILGSVGAIGFVVPSGISQLTPSLKTGILAAQKPVVADPTTPAARIPTLHALASNFTPREEVAPADPSNYGQRFLTDAYGNPVYNDPIVVIHETVGSAQSAINTFQTYHVLDADQRSYHALIRRDGTVVYIVPPEYRAFGAGNSVFDGPYGPEAVTTNPAFPPSVNNFAYHISLETPSDGRGNQSGHSGYTRAQYESLAWLTARTGVPQERITTHRAVDRSGNRRDPRSFNFSEFIQIWSQFVG